ncbi:molybdate ABC transporter substrate-binding protein [Limnohabitans sp. Rim11]|uniref:molybdate ABC transporter substrate-binding protein n=1 Tax=Limnohabitans sp. Rim11 TaxID=1100719 RepID=UPI000A4D52D2|nr:molybdate ABC transporter substrate-binding protein [Limnohabitans sp. Rim11]
MRKSFVWTFLFVAYATNLRAEEALVAVAANFSAPMQQIAASFQKDTGHQLKMSFGATGGIYAQIKNGGPFDVFLSADQITPQKLETEGLGVAATRFNYAIGQLVLWSKQDGLVDDKGQVLSGKNIQRIALANPKLAPYGVAAWETMTALGLLEELKPKMVQGDNIAQTYQFVSTQNAQVGFVALSQVFANGQLTSGSAWIVPPHLYKPIRQDVILLKNGKDNSAAKALLMYLKGEKAKAVMKSYGYLTE